MWVVIDNYDSFTHLLVHYLKECHHDVVVFRNDECTIAQLDSLPIEAIVLSPGPETPAVAGITMNVIQHYYTRIPMLGICLGHQAIGEHFGAVLTHAPKPMHGKTSVLNVVDHPLFLGIRQPMMAMRYHSLCLTNLPDELYPIATSEDGVIQAIQHNKWPCTGLQFHPESIGTPDGKLLLRNWASQFGLLSSMH